jgi:hypothetical protein
MNEICGRRKNKVKKKKVKVYRYMPWRRMGGEVV